MPVDTNLFSVSSMTRLKPWSPRSDDAVFSTSSFSSLRSGFSLSSAGRAPSMAYANGTLARPSEMHTTTTLPTSPDFCALSPVRTATLRAWARGEPPPHGMVSRRRRAMAIERVGGRSTSAKSPWKGMMQILSRLWYASVSSDMAAPLAAFMRLRAIDPDASQTKMMREPALRAILLIRTSEFSMNTLRVLSSGARPLLGFWYGAAARMVASTARRVTLPLGSIGLM
mmetsp:Transcript_24974/g.51639  ORF Transcript_24974/g.51639 Transcript_24974/m.51639 type:complete len:227 (-) Transcript_24974:276-956(-)